MPIEVLFVEKKRSVQGEESRERGEIWVQSWYWVGDYCLAWVIPGVVGDTARLRECGPGGTS